MAITTQIVSVGTATVTLASPTIDSQAIWLENLEPSGEISDYSQEGYQYCIDTLISISNGGTALFSFTTGDTGAQLNHWEFVTTVSDVYGELIEDATITTTGTAVAGHNHNRNFADDYDAVIETASALTGGTKLVAELVTGSNQASGGVDSGKIITLKPNTEYGFRFTNTGGQITSFHGHVGWVEKYNGYNDVWINGAANESVRLRGGERIQFDLQQGEGLTGEAIRDGVQVAVMRQD